MAGALCKKINVRGADLKGEAMIGFVVLRKVYWFLIYLMGK